MRSDMLAAILAIATLVDEGRTPEARERRERQERADEAYRAARKADRNDLAFLALQRDTDARATQLKVCEVKLLEHGAAFAAISRAVHAIDNKGDNNPWHDVVARINWFAAVHKTFVEQRRTTCAQIDKLKKELKPEREQLLLCQKGNVELTAERDYLNSKVDEYAEKVATWHRERPGLIRDIARLNSENTRLAAANDVFIQSRPKAELEELKDQLSTANDQVQHGKANHDNLVKHKQGLENQVKCLQRQNKQLKDDLLAGRKLMDETDKQLASLQASLIGSHGRDYCTGLENRLAEAERQLGCECTISKDLRAEINTAHTERDRLLKFKAYVHSRLDAAGVPPDPQGAHSEAGCRVGDRLDIALASFMETSRINEAFARVLHAAKYTCESLVMPRVDTQDICGLRELRAAVVAHGVEIDA